MEYLIRDDILKSIADEIRRLTGTEEAMTLGEMKEVLAAVEFGGGSSGIVGAIADGWVTELTAEDFGDCASIRKYAFYECKGLVNLELPDTIRSIGEQAFYGCSGLTYIKMPYSVTLGTYAFQNCSNVDTVEFTVGRGSAISYSNASDLPWNKAKNVIFGAGITRIPDYAFNNCTSIVSVILPDSITYIGQRSFVNTSITDIRIPKGVTAINTLAFSACSKLTSVTIPKNVTNITSGVFNMCTALTDVYYEGTEEEWAAITIDATNNEYLLNATLHYNTPM